MRYVWKLPDHGQSKRNISAWKSYIIDRKKTNKKSNVNLQQVDISKIFNYLPILKHVIEINKKIHKIQTKASKMVILFLNIFQHVHFSSTFHTPVSLSENWSMLSTIIALSNVFHSLPKLPLSIKIPVFIKIALVNSS